jgi:hypothetical protein
MTTHIKTTRRSAMMAALLAAFDEGAGPGKLRIYTGSQPANADTAASGTLLLEFTLNDPAFTESGGVLTLDVSPTLTDDALATGTAGWGRFVDSDDEAIIDGLVGSEITLSDTSLETGQTVTVTSYTITLGA